MHTLLPFTVKDSFLSKLLLTLSRTKQNKMKETNFVRILLSEISANGTSS